MDTLIQICAVCLTGALAALLLKNNSPVFTLLLLMYDAMNVRRTAGEMAKIVNYMMENWSDMISYEQITHDENVRIYIDKANQSLAALGFTEHSFPHARFCACRTGAYPRGV